MASRKTLVIATLAAIAVGYLMLPIYLGLSEAATDIVAAALLPLAICIWTFEDHRSKRSRAQIFGVLVPAFLAMFLVGTAVLLSGVRFEVLIPVNAILGGILYWSIDKYVPANAD